MVALLLTGVGCRIWVPEEEGEWLIVDHQASRVRALAALAE